MNLYLRIKLYIMRKLFGKGPVDVVIGPMSKMLSDIEQVATNQNQQAHYFEIASEMCYNEADRALAIKKNFENFMS